MLNFFRSNRKETQKNNTPVIFFHEDFYRQIEFVPEENYFERNAYIDKLPQKQTSENGYIQCIAREDHPFQTINRKIPVKDIDALLSPLAINYFKEVKTGYGQSMYDAEYTYVWGFDGYGIFIETDFKYKIVHHIFIVHNAYFRDKKDGTNLAKALISIGKSYHLVLIDWNKNEMFRVSLKEEAIRYFDNSYLSLDQNLI